RVPRPPPPRRRAHRPIRPRRVLHLKLTRQPRSVPRLPHSGRPAPVPEETLHIATMCEWGGPVMRGKEIPMGNWQLDRYHTQVEFSAKHLGMMTVRGYFDEVSTTADIDPDHPETAKVEATISTASIRTNNGIRDNDIRSSNF